MGKVLTSALVAVLVVGATAVAVTAVLPAVLPAARPAAAGAPCAPGDEGFGVCSADRRSMILCRGGALQTTPCSGPAGCTDHGQLHCDQSVGAEGDACDQAGGACTADGRRLLACKDGKLAPLSDCGGPLGCHRTEAGLFCDSSVAVEGALCRERDGACTADGGRLLACKDGAMAVRRVCRGTGRCRVAGPTIDCEDLAHGEVGDPCVGAIGVCSVAGDALLGCEAGRFTVAHRCRCGVKDGMVACL